MIKQKNYFNRMKIEFANLCFLLFFSSFSLNSQVNLIKESVELKAVDVLDKQSDYSLNDGTFKVTKFRLDMSHSSINREEVVRLLNPNDGNYPSYIFECVFDEKTGLFIIAFKNSSEKKAIDQANTFFKENNIIVVKSFDYIYKIVKNGNNN